MTRAALFCLLLAAAPTFAHDAHHAFGAGEPGNQRTPARTVEVTASETNSGMSFAPALIDARKGEQIRFVIRNAGSVAHEFVLGDRSENAAHAKMMASMPDMRHNDPNAVTIEPGKTATIVWRFSKPGAFEFACLIPGHYESGMHGAVTVK